VNPDVGYLSDVWRLSVSSSGSASWQQLTVAGGDAPVARDKHALACVSGRVVLFGGFGLVDEEEQHGGDASSCSEDDGGSSSDSDSGSDAGDSEDGPAATFKWFDDLWELRVDAAAGSCSWHRAVAVGGPSCRAAPASAVHNDTMFVFGGRLANGGATPRDNALWSLTYCSVDSKWLWQLLHAGDQDTSSSPRPPGRSAAAAACLESGAFVIAGGTANDSTALADVWAFAHGRWHAVSSSSIVSPAARSAACCVALPASQVLLAFGSSGLDAATGISARRVCALHATPSPQCRFTSALTPLCYRYHSDAWLGFLTLKD
jgi:hypothetical protein